MTIVINQVIIETKEFHFIHIYNKNIINWFQPELITLMPNNRGQNNKGNFIVPLIRILLLARHHSRLSLLECCK